MSEPLSAGPRGRRTPCGCAPGARGRTWARRLGGAALALAGTGCAHPDAVRVVRAPEPGLSVRAETFYGHGAVSNDYTNVYAVYARGGREARQLVLSGEYLQDADLRWDGARHLVICLKDGYTGEFHNEVTLDAAGASVQLHSSLAEGCEAGPPPAARARAGG